MSGPRCRTCRAERGRSRSSRGIAPGPTDTHAHLMSPEEHRAYREEAAGRLPVGRPGTAEEVAHAAAYLMENSFTTGTTLDVDGGKR
ncbi:SDR family oxidoreductase [Streptomyces sp. NPDC003006]